MMQITRDNNPSPPGRTTTGANLWFQLGLAMVTKQRPRPTRPDSATALPRLLTTDEVATIFRLHPETVRRLVREKRFQPMPILDRPYRWLRNEIDAVLTPHDDDESTS